LFRPDGGIGLVDFGSVERFTFEISELIQCYLERSWQKGETAARPLVEAQFGPKGPYKRARKILPLLEPFCDAYSPRDPAANAVVDCRDPQLHELLTRCQQE